MLNSVQEVQRNVYARNGGYTLGGNHKQINSIPCVVYNLSAGLQFCLVMPTIALNSTLQKPICS